MIYFLLGFGAGVAVTLAAVALYVAFGMSRWM